MSATPNFDPLNPQSPTPREAPASTAPVPESGTHLPHPANLEFYQRRAKALQRAARSGEPEALERINSVRGDDRAPLAPESVQLSHAQFAIARASGFASWPRLRHHLAASAPAARLRPFSRELPYYEERAAGLVNAWRGGMEQVETLITRYLPESQGLARAAPFDETAARLLTARQHGFDSWDQLAEHVAQLAQGILQEPFLEAFEALKAGDEPRFTHCLDQHPDLIGLRGTNGNTLLSLAADLRREWGVDRLLAMGASPNLGNNYGWTSLHSAGYRGSKADAIKFLRHGASPHLSARGVGGTALVVALFWGHAECADLLAEAAITPVNLRVAGGLGRLDLLESCFTADGALTSTAGEAREFYRPHGGFPDWRPKFERQEILNEAFTYACRNGRDDILVPLLERGAELEGTPYFGTGLHWAAWKGRATTVTHLLQLGADVNHRANFGGPAHGVNITPMHIAAQNGHTAVVELLVEHGGDQNLHDDLYLGTPAGWANFGGHPDLAELLLRRPEAGIMDLVSFDRFDAVERRLKLHPEQIMGDQDRRVTPLHWSRTPEMVRLLLGFGASLDALDGFQRTPLDVAIAEGKVSVAEALRAAGAQTGGLQNQTG